jgi:hypothetical protein
MAQARLSVIAAQCTANAAAVATALGGGIVTSDVTALGDLLKTLALSPDIFIPLAGMCPPSLASTYIQQG